MTSASCPTSLTTCRPCWTNYERMHKESLSLSIHKSLRWCAFTYTSNLPPLFYDGVQLPYTDSFKYLGMVCVRRINLNTAADSALRSFTTGTFCIKQFVQKNDLANRYTDCSLMWWETYWQNGRWLRIRSLTHNLNSAPQGTQISRSTSYNASSR